MGVIVDIVEDIGGAIVDVVEDVIGAVGDAIDWVVDEIVEPVLDGVGDIVQAALDDPITTIAKITAVATGNAWALPLIDGAAVAANGGDLGDVVKAAAISYTTGKVGDFTSTYVNPKIASAGFNSTVEAAVQAGIKGGTQSATTAIIYGQDPLQAFATGGLNAAVGATLGQIADKIDAKYENFTGGIDVEGNPIVGGWEQLQDGVKDSITASLTAEITGGDVSASQFTSIISKYTGVSETMNKFLQENAGFDESQAIVMTNALTNAATVALEGNPELSSDAFFAKWDEYGMEALKDIVDRPVDAAIDKVTGASSATQDAANALNEASANAVAAADGYKATQIEIEQKVIEQELLEGIYNDALKAYNQEPTQATVDALNAAAGAYQTFADQFKIDYDNTLKPALDQYKADYDTYTAQIPELDAAYKEKTEYMMSDIDDLNASMKPVYDKATLAAALSLRPNFDAEAYKEFLGQDFDNVAEHFLLNGQQGPASKSEADATLDAIRLSTVENALAAKGLTLASLEPGQLAKYLAYANKEIKNAASITGLDLDKFANTMVADAALTPELTMALKDAGFIPQSTDDYNVFLSGEYIKLDAKNSDGSNIFVDTTGMTGDEVKDLLSANGYSTNNIVNVGSAFANAMDGGAGDPAFDKPSIASVDTAAVNFNNNPPEPTLDTVTFGAGVDVGTLTSGGAVLVNTDGKLSWELPSTKQEKLGETNVSSVASSANPNIDVVDVAFNALYGPLAFKEVPPGFSYLSNDKLTAFTEDGQISIKNLPPANGVVVATIAGLDDDQGKQFDEDTGGTLWSVYNKLKQVYLDETPEDQQEAFGNAASVVTGATGEMLQAISGLATLVGANPNNTVGQTAKNLLALSGDLRSDAWVAGAEDMQKRSQDYDKEWRQNNPGKEPTAAQKGWLKAQSIWGNLTEHPVQFLAENVASEILQEIPILVVSGGVGNVAKAALLQGGEAYAKKFATKAAVGSAVALDAAEAFGGTAAGAFDETYANAIAQGMSEQEATDLAMDTAQKAGTIALFTTAASAGIGGAALAKNLLGDNASEFAGDAFQKLGKKIQDGGTVAIKEGSTEFIEEALPQLFTATVNSQIDPNYDVAGSVFENGFMGAVSGYGVGATLYTGNAVADALMSLNPTVVNTVKNAGSAEAATAALNNLGITDTVILNNVLNSTYDTMYVSTNEAAKLFKDANPGFEPTDAEIESFVSNRPESDVAAAVASYIDPKFLDADEVKAAAAAEGITLTDEQAEAYVGQKDEAQAIEEIAAEYDPQGTTREEAEQFFAELGYTPTEEEITARIGAVSEEDQKEAIASYVDPRQVTEAEARKFFEDQGYDPTDEEVANYVGQGTENFESNKKDATTLYVDPRQVTDAEARKFFSDLGYTPTDEEVAALVGQGAESFQSDIAAGVPDYVNPRQITEAEARAALIAQGIPEPTQEQIDQFVGQGGETFATSQEEAIVGFADPLVTTYEEAKEFFTGLGFTPTRDQVLQFVGATSEEEQQAAVAEFVDPLYTDAEEAREFLESLGYTPTDAEVQRFTGQVRETQQEEAVGEYVDPRLVDADEVKAAYEALGLTRPTDNDIQELVGQYMESELAGKAEEYLPTARYNSIINILDNFTGEVGVSDEMQEALDIVKKDMIDALGDLGLEVAAIDQTVDNLTEAVGAVASGDVEATGLYGYIDTAIQELKEAGLTNEEVEATIGSVVGSPATVDADGNEVAATGIYATIADIGETVDNLNDLSTEDVTSIVTEAIGELENISAEDVGTIVDEIVGAPATDDAEATGLYATIGDLNNISTEDVTSIVTEAIGELENISAEDVENVVNGIVGAPATEDTDATGIYAAIDNNTNEILDILGNPATDDAEATGIYGYIDSAVDSLGTDLSTLAGNVGTPAEYDEDGNVTAEATGIYAQLDDLMSQGMTNAEAIATLAADFGVAVTDLTNLFNETTGEISEDIGVVAGDVSDIAGLLGEPAVTDNPLTEEDESKDPTGLFGIIAGYEAAGQERDEAIKSAVGDLAIQLGTTEQNILDQMGLDYRSLTDAIATSEAGLTEKIETVESNITEIIGAPSTADDPNTEEDESKDATGLYATLEAYENAGIDRDEALKLAIGDVATALGTTEENLLASLGETEASILGELESGLDALEGSLGADIDAVADLIGKPAREVTQTDIDFVIDLIAQENVSQELITQYDVTGDGIVDINDQTMLETALQGGDVTLADTSMFTPATGIYGEIDTQTDAITDMITDLNTQIETKINTQTQQQNVNDLANMLMQAEDIGGRRVDVKTPDVLADITPYSFESIFRDQGQAQKFVSPYGTARVPTTRPANNPAGPLAFASGFAEGGQVEDENDMLLRILGDM